uniref:Uncharacterized protein n=1 Tax=Astyanax mexicanus TaxID=7994 RepID=A0A8B9GQF0_ASTMX
MSFTESEILALRQKVDESEQALQKAAQYGLQLLDDKMDLQNKLEEQRVEMTAGLEQEKYSLQREVELKVRMLDSLHSEFDYFKNQQKQTIELQQAELERNHVVELTDVKNKVMYEVTVTEALIGHLPYFSWVYRVKTSYVVRTAC